VIAGGVASATLLAAWAGVQASDKNDEREYCGRDQAPAVSFPAEDSVTYQYPTGCDVSMPDTLCQALSRNVAPNVLILQGGHTLAVCYG